MIGTGAGDHDPNARASRDGPLQTRIDWLRRLEERIWTIPEDARNGPAVFAKRWLQIIDRSLRGLITNHGLTYASALTYTSLLAFVPLLAILLAVLKGFGVDQMARDALTDFPIVHQVSAAGEGVKVLGLRVNDNGSTLTLATNTGTSTTLATGPGGTFGGPQLINSIIELVNNTNFSKIGIVGFGSLLLLIISLLSQIERAMNEAWAVYRSRSVGRKLADYMNLLMVVLVLLVGFSALGTNKFIVWIHSLGGAPVFTHAGARLIHFAPFLLILVAFVFMYIYIPNTKVNWRSAVAGGIVACVTLLLMHQGFLMFQGHLLNSRIKVYGAFGSILLILFYIYLFWCIVLWGVEVSSAHQNLHDWRRRRRAWLGRPAERETLALRLAALLARPLLALPELPGFSGSLDLGGLADRLNLPLFPVAEMLEVFRENDLVAQTTEDCIYMLKRSPEELRVRDLLRMVRSGVMVPPAGEKFPDAEINKPELAPLLGQTVKDLAGQPLESIQTLVL